MIEYLPLVLTGLGLTASILYYTMTLRNANKTQKMQLETRQNQLFMQLFQYLNTKEYWTNYVETLYQTQWTDYEDFWEKYGPVNNPEMFAKISNQWMIYGELGTLVYDGVIEIEQIFKLQGIIPYLQWRKWGPIVEEERKRVDWKYSYLHFEYLGKMMKKYFDEGHGNTVMDDMAHQISDII